MNKIIFIASMVLSLAANAQSKSKVDEECREYFGKRMQMHVGGDQVSPTASQDEIALLNATVADYKSCCKKGTNKCFDKKWVDDYKIPKASNGTPSFSGAKRKKITCEEVSPASVICGGAVYLHETKGVLSCEKQNRLNNAKPVDDQGMGLESGAEQ